MPSSDRTDDATMNGSVTTILSMGEEAWVVFVAWCIGLPISSTRHRLLTKLTVRCGPE